MQSRDYYTRPLPAAPTLEDAIVMRLDRMNEILCDLAFELEASPSRVAYGAGPNNRILQNYPVPGMSRIGTVANPVGGIIQVPTTVVDVVDAYIGRGGLSLQNTGTNGCFIYFVASGDVTPAVATGYLAAGAAFNGKVSDEIWCGPLSAQGDGGATTLALVVI